MGNRINKLFEEKKNILSIYFTAGFPKLDDTSIIIDQLKKSGVDMIEIGIPFSDPLADGPIIQHSSENALINGMSLKLLFKQLSTISCQLPTFLMGYLNPVLQFGMENFCKRASEVGVDGVILPDLPIDEYLAEYKPVFEKYNLKNIFLITPQTTEKRIRYIDEHSDGFIYMVSSSSTTGTKTGTDNEKVKYFERIKSMELKNPLMVGFGISDKSGFLEACKYASGAIIGSAFVSSIANGKDLKADINNFIKSIK
jgi:tryptophan synthase alpha chain